MRRAVVFAILAACGASHPTPTTPPPDHTPAPDAAPVAEQDPPPPGLRLPTAIVPTAAELHLIVDPAVATYSGTVSYTLHGDNTSDVIWLDADPSITITSATIDGFRITPLPTSAGELVGFRAPHPISDGTLALAFTGAVRDDQNGVFVEEEDGKKYLFSQGEAIAARKAFPCFDEPSFKMPWTVSINAPAADGVFANEIEASATPEGTGLTHTFTTTPALPSYLVVFAVGPFEAVDVGPVGRNKIPARVIVPAGRSADAATAVQLIPKIVAADEDYLDLPLPWDKVDVVAVPVFFGAMENPGIITYEEDGVLADAAHVTPQLESGMIGTLAHELGHFWFGDDVTLAFWNDIWLNESFANWIAIQTARKIDPQYDDVAVSGMAASAMRADASLETASLRRQITDSDQIEASFDSIAYNKGATLLLAAQRQLGDAKFLTAIRGYIAAHERGNATSEDLIAAIEAQDATAAASFRAYLDQPGVPMVSATLDCKASPPTIHLHQERLVAPPEVAPAATWPIHVCAAWAKGQQACTDLTAADGDLALPSCPAWVDPGAAAAYARVLPDPAMTKGLLAHFAELPLAERTRIDADLSTLFHAGKAPLASVTSLVTAELATKDPHDLKNAIALAGQIGDAVDDAHRPAWRRWVIARFGKLAAKAPLVAPKRETGVAGQARRALLSLVGGDARDAKLGARVKKQLAGWLAGKAAPADVETLAPIAATTGDAAMFDRLVTLADTANPSDRSAVYVALGSFTDPALMAKADDLALASKDIVSGLTILGVQASTDDGAKAVGAFVRAHWDELVGKLPTFVRGALFQFQSVCSADDRAVLADFVAAHGKDVPDGERVSANTLARSDACIASRAANAADVAAWLKQ